MPEGIAKKRFSESFVGRAAGALLAVLWVLSMSTVDAHAYSALPYVVGLGVVVLLFIGACIGGLKLVRLPFVSWCALAVGVYFFVRSEHSYAQIEAWRESALIMSCAVYYVAGVYAGQGKGSTGLSWVLAFAVLANIIAFGAMRHPDANVQWLGRPNTGLTGANSSYITLYLYKNFAALFLAVGGVTLLWRALWAKSWSAGNVFQLILGCAGMGVSLLCSSRVVWLVLPVAAVVGWVQSLLLRLYARQRVGLASAMVGVVLVVALGIGLYSLFFGDLLSQLLTGVDSHLRYLIWTHLCEVIPNAPAWGYGVGAAQWEIVPTYSEWSTPNYAHNEYLQAWVDYGGIGVVLLLLILVGHLGCGYFALVSDAVEGERRLKIAMAGVVVMGMAVAAGTDFVWHDFSLAGMTAFCCGVLASPKPRAAFSWKHIGRHWAAGSGPRMIPVRAQGVLGRLSLLLLGGVFLCGCWQVWERTATAWVAQWKLDALAKVEGSAPQQRRLLDEVMLHYPDPAIMDYYVLLPCPEEPDWQRLEALLWAAHRANPKQLFTVVMLADVLGRQGKSVEVEKLLRRCYVGDGMDGGALTAWPSYYSMNLLQWAQQELNAGHVGRARSLFNYAFRVGRFMPVTTWRGGARNWTEGGSAQRKSFVQACKMDAATLNAMNVPEDHSWQLPLEPGGKPALYRRWGIPDSAQYRVNSFPGAKHGSLRLNPA